MKLEIDKDFLKNIVVAWDKTLTEVLLQVDMDGLKVLQPDKQTHVFIKTQILADKFETFEPEIEEHKSQYGEPLKIGVNLGKLKPALKKIKDETVSLELEESKLVVGYSGGKVSLPVLVLEDESDGLDMDKLEGETILEISTKRFYQAIDELSLVTAPVDFINYPGEDVLELSADSQTSEVEIELETTVHEGEQSVSMYDEKKMQDVQSALKKLPDLEHETVLEFGSDAPITITPNLEGYSFEWIIAPRIEER